MYAVTGITGQVGTALADKLLEMAIKVCAVGRNPEKLAAWAKRGCETAVSEMADSASLTRAFSETEGVFVLMPPNFDPSPGFLETRTIIEALSKSLLAARPGKVVCLSTIGAQASEENLLSQLGLMERKIGELPLPVTILRAAWFMENAAWDIEPARQGSIASFLYPLDKPFPMVCASDVGRTAAELLLENWQGKRVVELEGPRRVSPNDIATAFATVLGNPVKAKTVPRETWEELFRSQGMHNPEPRMRMLDGFNSGWIEFEGGAIEHRKGETTLEKAVSRLVNSKTE